MTCITRLWLFTDRIKQIISKQFKLKTENQKRGHFFGYYYTKLTVYLRSM